MKFTLTILLVALVCGHFVDAFRGGRRTRRFQDEGVNEDSNGGDAATGNDEEAPIEDPAPAENGFDSAPADEANVEEPAEGGAVDAAEEQSAPLVANGKTNPKPKPNGQLNGKTSPKKKEDIVQQEVQEVGQLRTEEDEQQKVDEEMMSPAAAGRRNLRRSRFTARRAQSVRRNRQTRPVARAARRSNTRQQNRNVRPASRPAARRTLRNNQIRRQNRNVRPVVSQA